MHNNLYPYYMNNYNQQTMNERIDSQIAQLQQMKEQMKNNTQQQNVTPPSINQTFQLAPNSNASIKYVNTIDDVKKEMVFADTPFFSNDMSVLWVKNSKNEIKTYELTEIVPLDEKDVQIEFLQKQIEDLRKEMRKNEQYISNAVETEIPEYTEPDNTQVRESVKNVKPSSVSRVSKSKKEQ